MHDDPIIDEVRAVRKKLEAECENDPKKIFDHFVSVQNKYKDRLVIRTPKVLEKKTGTHY